MFYVAAVSDSVERGFDEFFAWLPRLAAFLAVLAIGWIVARVVAALVRGALERFGFDAMLRRGAGGRLVPRITSRPSHALGTLAFWVVFLGALSIAVDVLGIAALEDLVAAVWAYMPNVLAALLIFVVAGAVAAAAAAFARRFMGDTPTGSIVATAVPILVMTIATFMILDQLMIAETIVTITYAALVGALALGAALAFGLGGRDVAARMLEGAYRHGQTVTEQAKDDVRRGVERARAEATNGEQAWSENRVGDRPTEVR